MNPHKNVAIVGGGIGGLTTALTLQQNKISSCIYESRTAQGLAEPSGAGIWVPANAMQVFARLGLAEKVLAAGYELNEIELLDYLSGSLTKVSLAGLKRKFAYSIVAIKRSLLHQILLDALHDREMNAAVSLLYGYRCQGIEAEGAGSKESVVNDFVSNNFVSHGAKAHGERVAISFFQKEKVFADYVVAADGLHSAIRQSIFPPAKPSYSGQTSWRAVVRAELPEQWQKSSVEIWGEGRRFGFSHLSADEVYWYATADMPALSATSGSADPLGEITSLQELFASFPAAVRTLVASAATVIRTDLSDLLILPQWYRGKIVLVGDAAHATTPNLGQGGAQAVEDGYLLAKMIEQYATPEEAFRQYQKIRQEKARRIVRRSRWFGQMAHLKGVLPRQLRNAVVKFTPHAINMREFEQLYRLNF
jgi:2-polyprenyl-6-methoxyphenol hydroxylase-like FAD-dependent oxidoreductase